MDSVEMSGELPFKNAADYQYFGALLDEVHEEELSVDEQKEREIMKLLLVAKNGTPLQSEAALRQLIDKAREFGALPLFIRILPLFMNPTAFGDQERLLLVKVLNGVVNKLGELVGPFSHKILTVIEPMLIDEDYNVRVEGREVISNLSKTVGLLPMIAAMHPDVNNMDKDVRKMTAIAFSVVASALGIPAVLPDLKSVCQSERSWHTRQTGFKIMQEIATLMGSAVLPHLRSLVEIIEHGMKDENREVRSVANLSLAAVAEAVGPDGPEIIMEIKQR